MNTDILLTPTGALTVFVLCVAPPVPPTAVATWRRAEALMKPCLSSQILTLLMECAGCCVLSLIKVVFVQPSEQVRLTSRNED